MRFKLTLHPSKKEQELPFNYSYGLSAWIYGVIAHADEAYAQFLHERGYTVAGKRKAFKDFVFSNLQIPKFQKPSPGDTALRILSNEVYLYISFHVDQSAENFIIGLFKHRELSLYNRLHRADFTVVHIEACPTPAWSMDHSGRVSVLLKTMSPMVIAERNERLVDQYLSPEDPRFPKALALNLADKCNSLTGHNTALAEEIKFELDPKSVIYSRLFTIKENQPEETKIRGYYNFRFQLSAPPSVLEVALNTGIGKYCAAAGCGYVMEAS